MAGRVALNEQAAPRVWVVDGDHRHDVFELLGITDGIARVRSPLLFEIGERLEVRIEQDGTTTQVRARVRAHVGPADAPITELELQPRDGAGGGGGSAR